MKQPYARSRGLIVLNISIFMLYSAFLLGCTPGYQARSDTSSNKSIKTLLVVPFKDQSLVRGEGATYRCALCGGMFTVSRVEKGADGFVTDSVVEILSDRQTIALILAQRLEPVHKRLLLDYESRPADLTFLTGIGRELGADAILTGSVYKFIQRVGSDFAADSPASVGLDLDLIDVKTGQLIWQARFDETQDYLTNNLLKIFTFFKRGGKWITAEKLAVSGLRKVLEGSPIP